MSLATRAGDLYYTFRFVKLLATPFEETDAFKLGIIDADGKRTSKQLSTGEEKTAFTTFHRLVFNIKKLLAKAPGGKSKLASYAAALFLLREKYDLSDKSIDKILKQMDVDVLDFMSENVQWYLLEDHMLSPGVYRLHNEKVDNETCQSFAIPNDKIRVNENNYPVGEIFGLNIYRVEHINSGRPLYVTLGEIYK